MYVDVALAVWACDGAVVDVGVEDVAAFDGFAAVVAAADGGAGSGEVAFVAVDGGDELAAFLVGADEAVEFAVDVACFAVAGDGVDAAHEPVDEFDGVGLVVGGQSAPGGS